MEDKKEIIILALGSSLAVTALLANRKNRIFGDASKTRRKLRRKYIRKLRRKTSGESGGKSYKRNKKQRNKRSCKRK